MVQNKDIIQFIKYFDDEWLVNHPNWFEGWNNPNNIGAPSTNKGNESINRVIKDQDTFRNLLDLSTFLFTVRKIIRKWSSQRSPSNPNCKRFVDLPTIDLKTWTLAYQWKKQAKILQMDSSYFVASQNNKEFFISDTIILKYKKLMSECNFDTFEHFVSTDFGYWRIELPDNVDSTNWHTGKCTCPWFYKNYMCKHIVGLALRLKLANESIPSAAKLIPLDRQRGVGRPLKCLKALEYQPHRFLSILNPADVNTEELVTSLSTAACSQVTLPCSQTKKRTRAPNKKGTIKSRAAAAALTALTETEELGDDSPAKRGRI